MLIIGHPLIPFKKFYKVTNIEEINKTKPNCTILFDFINKEVLEYVKANNLSFALRITSLREACLSNAMNANFIIVDCDIANEIQNVANEYLFDTKVLLLINTDAQIEYAAKSSIDGVIFSEAIV